MTRILGAVAALCAIIFLSTVAAFAQTTVDVGAAWSSVQTWLITIMALVVSAIAGRVLTALLTHFNIKYDAAMARAVQSAAVNAAGLLLNRLGNQLQGKTIDVKHPFVADLVSYVLKAVPDAVAHFGLTPEGIAEKIVAKLPQIANTSTAPTPPAA
jgi:cyanate permease